MLFFCSKNSTALSNLSKQSFKTGLIPISQNNYNEAHRSGKSLRPNGTSLNLYRTSAATKDTPTSPTTRKTDFITMPSEPPPFQTTQAGLRTLEMWTQAESRYFLRICFLCLAHIRSPLTMLQTQQQMQKKTKNVAKNVHTSICCVKNIYMCNTIHVKGSSEHK